jgi:hypothetical protein
MNRLLLLSLVLLMMGGFISCTNKDKIPGDVLPKEEMEKVLWDMITAERYANVFLKDSALNNKEETFKLYAQVFALHNITREQFVKSYQFYMSRPDITRGMLDSLSTHANRRRDEMYKVKADSTSTDSTSQPTPVPVRADALKPDTQTQSMPTPVKVSQPVLPAVTPLGTPIPVPDRDLKKLQLKKVPINRLRLDSLKRRPQ